MFRNARVLYPVLLPAFLGLAGCGGGVAVEPPPKVLAEPTWTAGVFPDANEFAGICAEPRTGRDPVTGQPYADKAGTLMHEKIWLRSFVKQYYFWSDQIVDVDPADLSLTDYLFQLVTPDDPFSYALPYSELISEEDGVKMGYGIDWIAESYEDGTAVIIVKDIAKASPYFGKITRGDVLLEFDGMDMYPFLEASEEAIDVQNSLLSPQPGDIHSAVFYSAATKEKIDLELIAEAIPHPAVPRYQTISSTDGQLGYLQFDAHIEKSENELINAIGALKDAGIDDLVLDLRYNPGGLLEIASKLAYMIAGPENTRGNTFMDILYNHKYGELDAFTKEPVQPMPFYDTTEDSKALPSLDLRRVFVLIGPETCSASEAIINGLKGVGVDVFLFGSTTCGKPFGFTYVENCGTAYGLMMFKGKNNNGFGDYETGFSPSGAAVELAEDILPGCLAQDDPSFALGDAQEPLLAAALHFREHQACPSEPSPIDITNLQLTALKAPSAWFKALPISRSR